MPMRRYNRLTLATVCLIFFISGDPAASSEIFHWVDEDGVLNFSDWAPENSDVEVAKLVVSNSNPPGYDPNEDQSSILEQAERMNDRWSELKERQEDRRKQRLEFEEQQRRLHPVAYEYPYYNDPYFYYRPGNRPGFGHRRPFKVAKRQFAVLDHLGLTGPRPHSINSSAHLARINAGKALNGNFRPQRAPKMPRAPTHREW
jgi:hypothetical protein